MRGFDVNRFVLERTPAWERLETLLSQIERDGIGSLELHDARALARLYRAASSDLIRARSASVDASVVDYLNDLVARAYAQIHTGSLRRGRQLWRFFTADYPRLVRREWRAVAVSTVIFMFGGVLGAGLVGTDSDALGVLLPEMHQELSPTERIARDRERGPQSGADAVTFSAQLFTNNIRVTFTAFALGLTFGVGTAVVLFFNGLGPGALAMQYHQAGEGTFFWAWILPHGIPELTSIFISGAAGLLLARALWFPGRRRRRDALIAEAKTAAKLIVGTMPILVAAGFIEGTISQLHPSIIPAWAKLTFAALIGIALYAYLGLAGRSRSIRSQR